MRASETCKQKQQPGPLPFTDNTQNQVAWMMPPLRVCLCLCVSDQHVDDKGSENDKSMAKRHRMMPLIRDFPYQVRRATRCHVWVEHVATYILDWEEASKDFSYEKRPMGTFSLKR